MRGNRRTLDNVSHAGWGRYPWMLLRVPRWLPRRKPSPNRGAFHGSDLSQMSDPLTCSDSPSALSTSTSNTGRALKSTPRYSYLGRHSRPFCLKNELCGVGSRPFLPTRILPPPAVHVIKCRGCFVVAHRTRFPQGA